MSKKIASRQLADPDYTKLAADHLRDEASKVGLNIRSSHAHALVAAFLGYSSRIALLSHGSAHYIGSQWLHEEAPASQVMLDVISRMSDAGLGESHLGFLQRTIADGLTPACSWSGRRSSSNLPVGRTDPGDDADDWVHPWVARDTSMFGRCRCCGSGYIFRRADLDEQGLCSDHRGEFDRDPEEQKDWDDWVENISNRY